MSSTELTSESIAAARQWFADNSLACARLARARGSVLQEDEFYVNNLERYRANKLANAQASLAGEYDHTFAFLQKAHYIQTGECVALLPSTV